MKAEEIRIQLRDLIVTIMKKIEEKRVLQDKETMNIMRNIINIKIENMRLIKKYDHKGYRDRRRSSSSSRSRRHEKKYKDEKKGKYYDNDEDLKFKDKKYS